MNPWRRYAAVISTPIAPVGMFGMLTGVFLFCEQAIDRFKRIVTGLNTEITMGYLNVRLYLKSYRIFTEIFQC